MDKILFVLCTYVIGFVIIEINACREYCVIGAGPAGLQMGYYLQQKKRDYLIFERGSRPGSFFEKFPRHDTLISINKIHTGHSNWEFNLRHDWNSLLSEDLSTLFRHYSLDFFPHRNQLLQYLQNYQKHWDIKVQFNTTISKIHQRGDNQFFMEDQHGKTYSCKILIIATGLFSPSIPDILGIDLAVGYENMNLSIAEYEDKDVLILGKGNSAFEVANAIYGVTNMINIASNSEVRFAWATHYVGDLRAINNAILDTYQLKSLDGILEIELRSDIIRLVKCNKTNKINLHLSVNNFKDYFVHEKNYDIVIRCTGWKFDWSIFDETTIPKASYIRGRKKYPKIRSDYSSVDYKNLYFAGTLTHSIDFPHSAGGFIHGFRYTIKALHNLLENTRHGQKWPHSIGTINTIVDHFIKRINEGSGNYQMFSNLGDIAIISDDGQSYIFIEEYPILQLNNLERNTRIISKSMIFVFVFEYGRDFNVVGGNPFSNNRAQGFPIAAHKSNFLHPVVYAYKKLPTEEEMNSIGEKDVLPKPDYLHHIAEDFYTNWRIRETSVIPFKIFVENVIQKDLSTYSAEICIGLSLTLESPPLNCDININTVLSIK